MSDVVKRAAEFAAAAHESINQRRKYSGEPYIVHPTSVAALVSSVTDDPSTVAAAWLHDVVEDTPVGIETIEDEFGPDISGLVSDLTDVSQPADGNRRQRKATDRKHTAQADPRAKTVKLADVIDNLSDIDALPVRFAVKYLNEKEQLLHVLSDGDSQLFRKARQLITDLRERLEKS